MRQESEDMINQIAAEREVLNTHIHKILRKYDPVAIEEGTIEHLFPDTGCDTTPNIGLKTLFKSLIEQYDVGKQNIYIDGIWNFEGSLILPQEEGSSGGSGGSWVIAGGTPQAAAIGPIGTVSRVLPTADEGDTEHHPPWTAEAHQEDRENKEKKANENQSSSD